MIAKKRIRPQYHHYCMSKGVDAYEKTWPLTDHAPHTISKLSAAHSQSMIQRNLPTFYESLKSAVDR